jgi:hyperosmotically inducible protein
VCGEADNVDSGSTMCQNGQLSTLKEINIMNAKLVTTFLLAGALALPIIGYCAEGDSDRSSPKAFVKDSVITTKIKAQLAEEKLMSLVRINVDTDNKGMVVLSGNAANQNAIDKAVKIAHGVSGVTSVQNDIKIKAEK